jgi:hypothetical protein
MGSADNVDEPRNHRLRHLRRPPDLLRRLQAELEAHPVTEPIASSEGGILQGTAWMRTTDRPQPSPTDRPNDGE